jgi:lipopolysaccharide transport system permease protein
MVGVLTGFRWALLGSGPAPMFEIGVSVVVTVVVLVAGVSYFRRTERTFADVI